MEDENGMDGLHAPQPRTKYNLQLTLTVGSHQAVPTPPKIAIRHLVEITVSASSNNIHLRGTITPEVLPAKLRIVVCENSENGPNFSCTVKSSSTSWGELSLPGGSEIPDLRDSGETL